MARSKSTPGTKANRTGTDANTSNKEQANTTTPANRPDVKAVAPEVATHAIKSEAKPQNEITPAPRKLEVAKPDPRRNLVPINMDDEIRRRAYELYEQRGSSSGHETEDWLTAESEVLQRYHQRSA
jgi:hypothetical protein